MSEERVSVSVGTHQVTFEPPSLVHIQWRGAISSACVHGIFDWVDSVDAAELFVLADISRSEAPDTNIRRLMVDRIVGKRVLFIAVVETSPAKRAVMDMLSRAMRTLAKQTAPVEFFTNEADARTSLIAAQSRRGQTPA